jgi:hypothetical protein
MQTYIVEQEIQVPNWLRTNGKVTLSNLSSITILFGKILEILYWLKIDDNLGFLTPHG